MARPLRLEFPGAIWHLTNRGVNRQDIFFSEGDRRLFVDLLAEVVTRYGWLLHAWVEMTNHFHLLVETPEPNLSVGMRDLEGDFAQEINRRHGRVGHLFQGRFRGELVEKETHLLEVMRYVVLNPVRAGMVDTPGDWPWSSYRATAGLEPAPSWLEVDWTLAHWPSPSRLRSHERYREFVASAIGQTDNPWETLRCGLYLGSAEFGERLARLVGERAAVREFPRDQRKPDRPTLDQVESAILAHHRLTSEQLRIRRGGEARIAFALLARDQVGLPCTEIASRLGLTPSGLSKVLKCGRVWAKTPAGVKQLEAIRKWIKTNGTE